MDNSFDCKISTNAIDGIADDWVSKIENNRVHQEAGCEDKNEYLVAWLLI